MTASENRMTEIAEQEKSAIKSAGEIGFEDLIAPVTSEVFFAEYWEKRPMVTRGRPADFFAPLFSISDVDRVITYLKPKPSRIEVVTDQGFVRDNYLHPDGTANLNLVLERYLEGSTIILLGLDQNWEPLALFSSNLEAYLSHPVGAGIYLTPPNFHGVNPHFDTQENFVLQVEGTKQWRVYNPLNELPSVEGSYRLVPREKLSEPICETLLEPGDALYIPRGFIHEATAGPQPSLHITVDVAVRTWYDFLSDALASMAEKDPRFRRSLPAGFLRSQEALRSLSTEFEQYMENFSRDAGINDAVRKHTEALAVRKPPTPDGHFSMLHAEIGPDTRLKKRRTTVTRVFEENGVAGIQFSGNQILGPAKIIDALKYIAEAETITPASLPNSLNENEKLVLVRRLLRTGLLTLA